MIDPRGKIIGAFTGEIHLLRKKSMTEAEFARLQQDRRLAGLSIDPETAEIICDWGQVLDPYGDLDRISEEFDQIGRLYLARGPGSDQWICFYDLPEATVNALWKRIDTETAQPHAPPGWEWDGHRNGW